MSKEELSIMHACMCICLYIEFILLIYYLCHRSLFKTLLYLFFFENIHLEKLLTCLSALSLSVPAQVPFCDPAVGPVRWPSLWQAWAGSCRAWFILRVPVAGTSETSCTTAGQFPAGMAVGRGALDSVGCSPWPHGAEPPCTLWPWGKPPALPRELGPETAASCWQCQSSEAERHSRLFWLKIGQDLIEMKEHFW